MSIFRDFFVKQKPVFTGITRGVGGFGFGSGGGGGGGSAEGPFSASGGDVEYTYNGKRIHVFTTAGPSTFVVTETLVNAEVFIVGGGGGAGDHNSGHSSGGGGAGGVATGPAPTGTFTAATYPITVGAGGAGGGQGSQPADGASGSDSLIGSAGSLGVTVYGKGGGGTNADGNGTGGGGITGGSGGGGSGRRGNVGGGSNQNPANPHPWIADYGNDGGASHPGDTGGANGGGGGGGAGSIGGTSPGSDRGGNGGLGIAIPSTFRDPSNPYGDSGAPPQPDLSSPGNWYFAGGGGGAEGPAGPDSNAGAGGLGHLVGSGYAGGHGVRYAGSGSAGPPDGSFNPYQNGKVNTGGGGGGGSADGDHDGGNGGDGIVFIAYDV